MKMLRISADDSASVYLEDMSRRPVALVFRGAGSEVWWEYLTRLQARKLAAMLLETADAEKET